MDMREVDLYRYYSFAPPAGAVGRLTAWHYKAPEGTGNRRTRPGVLILSGGGYSRTSDREAGPVALWFAALGYIPFVFRCFCAPHSFPVALRKAAMAMRYIRKNSGELDVDPRVVAAVGFSAGGRLCTLPEQSGAGLSSGGDGSGLRLSPVP